MGRRYSWKNAMPGVPIGTGISAGIGLSPGSAVGMSVEIGKSVMLTSDASVELLLARKSGSSSEVEESASSLVERVSRRLGGVGVIVLLSIAVELSLSSPSIAGPCAVIPSVGSALVVPAYVAMVATSRFMKERCLGLDWGRGAPFGSLTKTADLEPGVMNVERGSDDRSPGRFEVEGTQRA